MISSFGRPRRTLGLVAADDNAVPADRVVHVGEFS
jgi:hypothetical protein